MTGVQATPATPPASDSDRGRSTAPHDARGRGWHWLAWGAILTGTLLRLAVAREGHSLWLDEAMLALNVLGRGWAEQFHPPWYEQAAPPLYLLVTRLVATPLGGSEFGLRLPALMSGLALLIAVWSIGRHLVGPEAGAWATWIIALSVPVVHYSNELKPYMTDALVTLALIGMATRVSAGDRRYGRLAAFGAVAVLLSFPSVFVLAPIGCVLLADGLHRREPEVVRAACGLALLWSLVFLAGYLLIYRATAQSEFMQLFWHDSFLHPGDGFLSRLANALAAAADPLPVPGRFRGAGFLLAGMGLTAVVLATTAPWRLTTLLVGPFVLVGLASALGLYPFGGRTLLFLVPISALVVATAIVNSIKSLVPGRAGLRFVLAGLLLLPDAVRQQAGGPTPIGAPRNEREVVAFLAAIPDSDAVLLHPRSAPAWLYYTENWRRPDRARIAWHAARFRPLSDSTVMQFTAARVSGTRVGDQGPSRIEFSSTGNGLGIRSDGTRHLVPFPSWGPRVSNELTAMGVSRVWVYTARETDLEALAAAWQQAGGAVALHEPVSARKILELSRPGQP